MDRKERYFKTIKNVKELLKQKIRESWTTGERKEVQRRGEMEADFYQIWYRLCKLETMEKWINVHGYLTRSQINILKEYVGEDQWKKLKEF